LSPFDVSARSQGEIPEALLLVTVPENKHPQTIRLIARHAALILRFNTMKTGCRADAFAAAGQAPCACTRFFYVISYARILSSAHKSPGMPVFRFPLRQ
jgi:hypothetical protein